jgi:hypothetical protein
METIRFKLNGRPVRLKVDGERTLLWVLRTDLGVTGPKYGCGEEVWMAAHKDAQRTGAWHCLRNRRRHLRGIYGASGSRQGKRQGGRQAGGLRPGYGGCG